MFISATVIDSGGNVEGDFQNVKVPFKETSLSNTWTQQTESDNNKKSQLTLNYRLVRCSDNFTGDKCDQCEDNYHTDRCNVECAPAEGYYTCDESTGGRICESGKIGVNCDQCEDGNKVGKDCDTCKTGFAGDECDRCAPNHYPEGTWTVICEPEEEKYKCLESGAKECLGNRAGDECEECRLNYYGGDCEKFCKSSTSFTCDQTGSKNCRHNYFNPEKECDTYCDPAQGSYTCNPDTGEKICEPGKIGDNCEQCENNNKIGNECETCKSGFTGEECDRYASYYYPVGTCTKHCEPAEGKYTCTEHGSKKCVGNRIGEDCDSCKAKYYGYDCKKLCEHTEYYTCDEAGNKVCEENYYPDKDCSTFCEGVEGNYTCNTVTGEKNCEEGKTGVNCDQCENGKIGDNCDKCKQHYFGEECQIFCKSQEHYHCSLEGKKLCEEYYFGGQCQTFCKPNELYSCSYEGYKVCLDNTTSVAHNCRTLETEKVDVVMVAGIGGVGGGVLVILLVTVICLGKMRQKEGDNTGGVEEGIEMQNIEGGYQVCDINLKSEKLCSEISSEHAGCSKISNEHAYATTEEMKRQSYLSNGKEEEIYTKLSTGRKQTSNVQVLQNQQDNAYSMIEIKQVYEEVHSHVYDRLDNLGKS